MKFKRFLSIMVTLALFLTTVLVSVNASTDSVFFDNVIDITDKVIYERGLGAAKVINIKIGDTEIESAKEDNTQVDIVLDSNTQPDATITVEFGTLWIKT